MSRSSIDSPTPAPTCPKCGELNRDGTHLPWCNEPRTTAVCADIDCTPESPTAKPTADEFACCGGNDARPKLHTADCDEYGVDALLLKAQRKQWIENVPGAVPYDERTVKPTAERNENWDVFKRENRTKHPSDPERYMEPKPTADDTLSENERESVHAFIEHTRAKPSEPSFNFGRKVVHRDLPPQTELPPEKFTTDDLRERLTQPSEKPESRAREFTFSFVKELHGFSVIWDMAKCADINPVEDFKPIHVVEYSALEAAQRDGIEQRRRVIALMDENARLTRELEQAKTAIAGWGEDAFETRKILAEREVRIAELLASREEWKATARNAERTFKVERDAALAEVARLKAYASALAESHVTDRGELWSKLTLAREQLENISRLSPPADGTEIGAIARETLASLGR